MIKIKLIGFPSFGVFFKKWSFISADFLLLGLMPWGFANFVCFLPEVYLQFELFSEVKFSVH
jgi:hypothetical protein